MGWGRQEPSSAPLATKEPPLNGGAILRIMPPVRGDTLAAKGAELRFRLPSWPKHPSYLALVEIFLIHLTSPTRSFHPFSEFEKHVYKKGDRRKIHHSSPYPWIEVEIALSSRRNSKTKGPRYSSLYQLLNVSPMPRYNQCDLLLPISLPASWSPFLQRNM